MRLDPQICYAAIKSRDRRFDGRFFTAVKSTGIYCRPVCPAITPRPENVQFYVSATAAAEAGFRPCLRCRPESSPGTPDWVGSSTIVSRGLRLISEGVLDEAGVELLAQRLNIGARQLRRLFVKYLGAPPIAVAQTRRLHFAKKLIDETNLPMSEIAFCAGYSSIRRFNDAIRNVYDRPPTELRKAKNIDLINGFDGFQLRLSYRPPFDWHSLIQYLEARAIPGVESVSNGRYRRVVEIGQAVGVIEVDFLEEGQGLLLRVPPTLSKSLMQISERIRTVFDLRADPAIIVSHLERDEQMARLIRRYPGLRLPGAWDGFELAVRAILGQQISIKAANTLAGRLVEAYGEPLEMAANDDLVTTFPRPERLAEADLADLGLMPRRAAAVRGLARAVCDDQLRFDSALGLEKSLEQLKGLPGIGPWTANYIAMRAMSEPDAFPAGDLALRRAAVNSKTTGITEAQLRARAELWRPWRAYAAIYLWRHYATISNGGYHAP